MTVRVLHELCIATEGIDCTNNVLTLRIQLCPSDRTVPFELRRRQFAIKTAFPVTTSKAHNMPQYVYIHRHLFLPLHSSVWRSPSPLYRTSSLFAFIEDHRLLTENNISITSYIVYREALRSYRYINKYLLIKCLIVCTRQLFARVSVPCCRNVYYVA